jgi:hypothetical protein
VLDGSGLVPLASRHVRVLRGARSRDVQAGVETGVNLCTRRWWAPFTVRVRVCYRGRATP